MNSTVYEELDFSDASALERWCSCSDIEEDGLERKARDPFGDDFESRWEPVPAFARHSQPLAAVRSIGRAAVGNPSEELAWLQAA